MVYNLTIQYNTLTPFALLWVRQFAFFPTKQTENEKYHHYFLQKTRFSLAWTFFFSDQVATNQQQYLEITFEP